MPTEIPASNLGEAGAGAGVKYRAYYTAWGKCGFHNFHVTNFVD